MDNETTLSLREEIKKLNENLSESIAKKETKKFKFPMRGRLNKKRVKTGWASICYINENKGVNFMRVPIKESTVLINGIPYLATPEHILNYNNKPFLIVPSWTVEPFSPSKNLDEAQLQNRLAIGNKLILNTLKSEQIQTKPKFDIRIILIILAVIIAAVYFLNRGGYLG